MVSSQPAVASAEPGVAMARRGALFMWGFAVVWALVGLGGASLLGLLPAVAVIGAGLAAGVLLLLIDRRGGCPPEEASPVRLAPDFQRRFRQVNIAQGVLIGLVVAGLVLVSQPQFITPAVALVVGLHFWPLARIFDQPHLATVCWRLVVVAALGAPAAAVAGPELAQAVSGLGAAAVLIAAGVGVFRPSVQQR